MVARRTSVEITQWSSWIMRSIPFHLKFDWGKKNEEGKRGEREGEIRERERGREREREGERERGGGRKRENIRLPI